MSDKDKDNNNDNNQGPTPMFVVPPFLKEHQNKSTLPPQKSTNNRTLSMSATYTSMTLEPIHSQSKQKQSNNTKRRNVEWLNSPTKMDKRTTKYRDTSFFKSMFDQLLDNNDNDSDNVPVSNITSTGQPSSPPSSSNSTPKHTETNSTFITLQAKGIIQGIEFSNEIDDTSTVSYNRTCLPDVSIKKKEKDLKKKPRDTVITNGENICLELRHITSENKTIYGME